MNPTSEIKSEYVNHKQNLEKIYKKKIIPKENKKPEIFIKLEKHNENTKKREMIRLSLQNKRIYERIKNIKSDFASTNAFMPNLKEKGYFFKQTQQKIEKENEEIDKRINSVKCSYKKDCLLKETNGFIQYFRKGQRDYRIRKNM